MGDCRKGMIDRIYTKSISRFARNTRDCLKNIRELKELGITVMFEKENIDTAKITDEIMITVMGGLAQEESMSISQNMKWSIKRRMKNGKFNAPSLPYGYTRINNEIIIIQDEAEVVRYIYSLYLNGTGMENIANILNQCVRKNSKGFIWCKNTIKYILTNEKYTGDAIFQKYYTTNQFPYRQKYNNGECDMYYTENVMPPIISQDIFDTAKKIHKQVQLSTGHNKGGIYLLSGKIKCSLCGSTYRRKMINGNVHWTCIKHNQNAALCDNKPISEADIKIAFIRLYNKIYSNYADVLLPLKKALQELELKQSIENENIIELRRNVLQLKEQLRVIAMLHTKCFLNEAKYKEQSSEINAKIEKVNKDLRLLLQSDNTTLKDIEILIDYFEKREHIMIEFEPKAFEFLVDKIAIKANLLVFHIVGGLVLAEEIWPQKNKCFLLKK
jgi:DNA invertase Pin-like site-specific DNA recombinase